MSVLYRMDNRPAQPYKRPQARTQTSNIIQYQKQGTSKRAPPPKAVRMPSTITIIEDDLPTPKPIHLKPDVPDSPITSSSSPSAKSILSKRDSSCSSQTDFEDMYDSSDSELVPLQVSNSIKQVLKRSNIRHERLPSLIIPSPSAWPTVQKLQQSKGASSPSSNQQDWPLSPAALDRLAACSVSSNSATPSLAGSLTSDEVTSITTASTPDLRHQDYGGEDAWGMAGQLSSKAMDALKHLSGSKSQVEEEQGFVGPHQEEGEMEERGLNINVVIPSERSSDETVEVISAISVPSPGCFFASLGHNSKRVWSLPPADTTPSTATAESFYFFSRSSATDLPGRGAEHHHNSSEGSPSGTQTALSRNDVEEVDEFAIRSGLYEYDDEYEQKLKTAATSNMSRTYMWLADQDTCLEALKYCNLTSREQPAHDSTLAKQLSNVRPPLGSPKKSVRFASSSPRTPLTAVHNHRPPASSSLFYQAFQHLHQQTHRREAFLHRCIRADAVQAQRLHLPELHRAQLQGRYALRQPCRPQDRFSHLPDPPDDEALERQRANIASAEKERQALQQLLLSFWNLEACRLLGHGRLLPKRAHAVLDAAASRRPKRRPRMLNLGGQPTADWGWAVALECKRAKVYTAVPTSPTQATNTPEDWLPHRGPSNHRTVTVPNAWTLPFPDNSMDVVSARSLHALLRTYKPSASSASSGSASRLNSDKKTIEANTEKNNEDDSKDEYDATLREILRVLVPGGILHFSLLDAEISNSSTAEATAGSSALVAQSVEFAVALRSRGYDPCVSRRFVAQMEIAGFVDIESAWTALPLGSGESELKGVSEQPLEAVTGMVGALEWEKWMLKLQVEMGRAEERLLDGVAVALEDGRRVGGMGWTGMAGCARKPWV